MSALSFRALDVPIVVSADDPSLLVSVQVITGTYPRATSSDAEHAVHYHLDRASGQLQRDGVTIESGLRPTDLPLRFEWNLYQTIVERQLDSFVVHAAAVSNGRTALVLVGASGAGKTTMTAALLGRGCTYITDETSVIDKSFAVRGLARPLGMEREAALAHVPHATEHSFEWLDRGGRPWRTTSLHIPSSMIVTNPVDIGAVIMLEHDPTRSPGLSPIGGGQALIEVWSQARRIDPTGWEIALDLVARHRPQRLVTSSVEQACADLSTVWQLP
jgi:hypothetical protein